MSKVIELNLRKRENPDLLKFVYYEGVFITNTTGAEIVNQSFEYVDKLSLKNEVKKEITTLIDDIIKDKFFVKPVDNIESKRRLGAYIFLASRVAVRPIESEVETKNKTKKKGKRGKKKAE